MKNSILSDSAAPCFKNTLGRLQGLLAILFLSSAQAGQYGETFDGYAVNASNLLPAGELFSNQLGTTAKIMESTMLELQLTADGTLGTFSAFRLPDLDPGSGVAAFSAKWNAQIYGASSGLADGFSFNFGPFGSIPTSSLTDGTYASEDGFKIGLSVGIRTYNDNTPGYYVRVNGHVVPSGFVAKAGSAWGNFNTTRHFFEVDWHYFNGLTLKVDGTAIFTNLPTPGFTPEIGNRFLFGARTGGLDQEMRLDNIAIVTGGTLAPVAAASPYYFNLENLPNEGAAKAFDNDSNTKWLGASGVTNLGASLSSSKALRVYALTSANDVPARDPLNWTFETGDNGSSWASRGSKSQQHFLNRAERRAFLVNSPASNSKFRLNITSNNGGPETQLADLQAWELTPGPAFLKVFSLADTGADSLRTALTTAGNNAGPAVITFSTNLAGGTIAPSSELVLADADGVAVDAGNLTGGIILSGSNAHRIMSNSGFAKFTNITFTSGNGASTNQNSHAGAFFCDYNNTTFFNQCTFTNNNGAQGGAVLNFKDVTMTDCAFYNNHATSQGGVIQNEATASMVRCTFANNNASSFGGAIENQSSLSLVHCTISCNQSGLGGGGVDNYHGNATIINSIIYNNTGSPGPNIANTAGTVTRSGANLIQSSSNIEAGTDSGPVALTSDPLLAPLDDYGGPTKTMALKLGSPARNASVSSSSTYDQRQFPLVGVPDLGAYEAGTVTNFNNWVWELLPGSATNAQHAASADFDGDGKSNNDEWVAQTDPANVASAFRMQNVSYGNGNLTITWPTVVGRSYAIEYSFDLTSWTNLGYVPGTGLSLTTNVGPLTGNPKVYLRVRVKN